jgi:hypothetical protein
MPGIPREVIEHKLGIDILFKPIKQKKEDTIQTGAKPCSKKPIHYLKSGLLDQ